MSALSRVRVPRALMVLSLLLGMTPAVADAQPWKRNRAYPDGQVIVIMGQVTDLSGQPIPNLDLRFETARRSFSVRKLRKVDYHPEQIATKTDADGNYRIQWPWHHFYNHFVMKAVVPVKERGGDDQLVELATLDIGDRIKQGTPVVAPMVVEDATFFDQMRSFLASIDTSDEQRIYAQEGKPDRIESVSRDEAMEESWWYFSIGSLYRFRDGELVEVENFDPVQSFIDD